MEERREEINISEDGEVVSKSLPINFLIILYARDEVFAIVKKHNLSVTEDYAQTCGVTYHGRWLGSFGHMEVLTFQLDKMIATRTVVTLGLYLRCENNMYPSARRFLWVRGISGWRCGGETFGNDGYQVSELSGALRLTQPVKWAEAGLSASSFTIESYPTGGDIWREYLQ